ncbi:MAG: hypothetical protein Q4B52_04255 [Tissierellia bacterium]|nr:hypothetical protein [Tissierellia bacterium]
MKKIIRLLTFVFVLFFTTTNAFAKDNLDLDMYYGSKDNKAVVEVHVKNNTENLLNDLKVKLNADGFKISEASENKNNELKPKSEEVRRFILTSTDGKAVKIDGNKRAKKAPNTGVTFPKIVVIILVIAIIVLFLTRKKKNKKMMLLALVLLTGLFSEKVYAREEKITKTEDFELEINDKKVEVTVTAEAINKIADVSVKKPEDKNNDDQSSISLQKVDSKKEKEDKLSSDDIKLVPVKDKEDQEEKDDKKDDNKQDNDTKSSEDNFDSNLKSSNDNKKDSLEKEVESKDSNSKKEEDVITEQEASVYKYERERLVYVYGIDKDLVRRIDDDKLETIFNKAKLKSDETGFWDVELIAADLIAEENDLQKPSETLFTIFNYNDWKVAKEGEITDKYDFFKNEFLPSDNEDAKDIDDLTIENAFKKAYEQSKTSDLGILNLVAYELIQEGYAPLNEKEDFPVDEIKNKPEEHFNLDPEKNGSINKNLTGSEDSTLTDINNIKNKYVIYAINRSQYKSFGGDVGAEKIELQKILEKVN